MRHTITIKGNNQIKNQRIHSKKLPNFQQDNIVKIEQGNKKLYAIYTPDLQQQKSQISLMYMRLNEMQESLATMSKIVTPSKLKYVEIQLSEIDYQLVNNNFGLLERSFLDQVNLVWPQGKIPLFYKQGNYISLMPKCNDVHLVDPYAAISFMIKQQVKNNVDKKQQYDSFQQQNEFDDKVLILSHIQQSIRTKFGYDNTIYVEKQVFDELKKFREEQSNVRDKPFYCTLMPLLPFLANPTFQEFQQYKKLQSTNKVPQLKPILVQIAKKQLSLCQKENQFQKINREYQENQKSQQISFTCSQICKLSLAIPQKLLLTEQNLQYIQGFQTISLQMFLKQLTSNKYRINLQLSNHKNLNYQDIQQLKNQFAQQFVKFIREKQEFVFLQNYYPFLIQNDVGGLLITKLSANKRSYETLKSFLVVKDISVSKEQNQQNDEKTIKVILKNLVIDQDLQDQKLNQWLPIMKKLQQKSSDKRQDNKIQSDKKFKTIFQQCYKKQLTQCCQYLTEEVHNNQSSFSKILVSTYSSNGKTYLHIYLNSLVQNKKSKINYRSWYVDCRLLIHPSNRLQQIKQYLDTVVSLCPYRLLFFDNVDSLIPFIQQGDQIRQREKIVSHVLGNYLFDLLQNNNKIAIFTAKSQANIDPIFKFNKIIKLKNPNRQLRAQIVHSLLTQNKQTRWIEQFIDKTESFSLGSMAHYLMSQQIPVKKQSKRKNDFSKIVGLAQAKRVIRSVIQKPNKFGFIYEKVKIKVPRGILLYGATGNGKTALGSAVEDEFPMKYFSVKGSDILSKYIGGSEAAVRQIFQKALSVAPSIIFFDEFESIVPRRNSSGTGVTDRVVNQFLCYLDGVSSTTGVFIIAASSRPDLIDPALLRPGRIDSHIYLQYPTQSQRGQLLSLFNNSVKLQVTEQQFIQSTANYSYSDLIGLLKQLRIKRSSLILKQKQNPSVQQFKYINKQLFYETIKSYRIGTDLQQQKTQNELYQRFKAGKGPQIKKQKFIQM